MATRYESKCQILADLWMDHRDDDEFREFVEYNDLGLPLAYAIANEIVESSDLAASFINETFRLLLVGMDLEDSGFDNLTDILGDDHVHDDDDDDDDEDEDDDYDDFDDDDDEESTEEASNERLDSRNLKSSQGLPPVNNSSLGGLFSRKKF